MKIKTNKSSSAFTLIELLVVIAIIAILAALAVPALTSALKVYPVSDAAPSTAIFATSHNYDYDTALTASASQLPYGTNGFIVIHKGGDAAVYKEGQAVAAGWGADPTVFQSQVGIKCIENGTCDPTGAPTVGDP